MANWQLITWAELVGCLGIIFTHVYDVSRNDFFLFYFILVLRYLLVTFEEIRKGSQRSFYHIDNTDEAAYACKHLIDNIIAHLRLEN